MIDGIGWTEMLTLVVLAIIVVGPKELPQLLRTIGKWVASARRMAREFQHNLEVVARETQLTDIQQELRADIKQFEQLKYGPKADAAGGKPGAPAAVGAEAKSETDPPAEAETPSTPRSPTDQT